MAANYIMYVISIGIPVILMLYGVMDCIIYVHTLEMIVVWQFA